MSSTAATAAVVFGLTYLVIGLQGLPRLRIGRPAGALLGAVAMVACGVLDFGAAKSAIDLDTLLFLLGMMIVLGYLEISGFFEVVERWILGRAGSARGLLWLVVLSSGTLAALFMNDTVCLMLTPIVVRVTRRLNLRPAPYLIALATAANIGSTATLLGNPQNALVAVRSGIGFLAFLGALGLPAAMGIVIDGAILAFVYRRSISGAAIVVPPPRERARTEPLILAASLACGGAMVVALMCGAQPATAAIAAAAVLILIGPARSRAALQQVDWGLLLFFGGLFVVMRGVERAGLADLLVHRLTGPLDGAVASGPILGRLAVAVTLLSQAVSNVPAVMLFVPTMQALPAGAAAPFWIALAAFATLAGNLTIIGSAANVIVFESAKRDAVEVRFVEYLRVGLPVTALTMMVTLAWLVMRG